MRAPPTWGGAADDGEGLDETTAWTGSSLDSPPRRRPQAPRRRPAAPQARLGAQTERLAWRAYLRALRLQQDEPGLTTTVIRSSVYTAWARAFLAWASS